jgi:hypothetical protein
MLNKNENKKDFKVNFRNYTLITDKKLTKITGTVNARQLLQFFEDKDILSPNPRLPKINDTVNSLLDSMDVNPELFQFKSKGILFGASKCKKLNNNNRFSIEFDSEHEGIQDGGHNFLALGLHILSNEFNIDTTKIKGWIELQDLFIDKFGDIRDAVRSNNDNEISSLEWDFPCEILVPAGEHVDNKNFIEELKDICDARNNNCKVPDDDFANKMGIYQKHKEVLKSTGLVDDIEWRTNEGEGRIKSRDIIALTWIPLLELDLPGKHKVTPSKIYASKQLVSNEFTKLMKHEDVCSRKTGEVYELKNKLIGSAITMLPKLMKAYDYIYEALPEEYAGTFEAITSVKWFSEDNNHGDKRILKKRPKTKYFQKLVKFKYPDGFIIPLVYSLGALMDKTIDGLEWKTDPVDFLDKHLKKMMGDYSKVIMENDSNPQVLAKKITTYTAMRNTVELLYIKDT